MKKIIYTRPDGGLFVVNPVRNTVGETLKTDAEIEQRAWDCLPADAINPQFVDASEIPADRTFRNAWIANSGKVDHDIAKCKSIAHEKRRARRAEEFAPLDVMATIPSKAAQAESQRQAIRDKYDAMQNAIDMANSVDEIKSVIG